MKMQDDVFNWAESEELTFVEIPLSEEVRQTLPSYKMHADGSLACYDDDYGEIYVLLQDAGEGSYWAYLRDYGIGSLVPLGDGIFDCDENYLVEDVNFAINATIDLQLRFVNGDIDLDKELYDYYHNLPSSSKVYWYYSGKTMSVQEAAAAFNCTASHVKKMVESRKLEGFKVDGEIRITSESVDGRLGYIEKNGTPTKSTTFKMMNSCSVMTPEKTDECYEQAMAVYSESKSISDAAYAVANNTGMKETSARMYINAILAMINGELFGDDINTFSVNRYLDRIYEDFGKEVVRNARKAIMARFENTRERGNTCWYYKKAAERSEREHV